MTDEIGFLYNIDWEAGERPIKNLALCGLLRPSHKDQDLDGAGLADAAQAESTFLSDLTASIPEAVLPDI